MVDFCIETKADNDELLALAKDGCVQSINEVLSRCRVHIRSHVNKYLGKRTRSISADDVTQEVLFVVYRDLCKCRAERWSDFLQFLVTVSRNKTLHAIEKMDAKKRGGSHRTESLAIDVPMDCNAWLESNDLNELIAKLETITKENADHQAVLESYLESLDRSKTHQIALAQTKTGKTRQQTYANLKRFKSEARAVLNGRHNPELIEAVKDDIRTGQCRRSMRSCYGLCQSELDAIEVSR